MSESAIDIKEVMERVQDDKELLMELLQIFLEDYAEKKKLLAEAVAKGDLEQIKSIAHGMKGASGNISAKKLRASFFDLEQTAKTPDMTKAGQILNIIDAQINELKEFIEHQLKK